MMPCTEPGLPVPSFARNGPWAVAEQSAIAHALLVRLGNKTGPRRPSGAGTRSWMMPPRIPSSLLLLLLY